MDSNFFSTYDLFWFHNLTRHQLRLIRVDGGQPMAGPTQAALRGEKALLLHQTVRQSGHPQEALHHSSIGEPTLPAGRWRCRWE